MTRLPPGPRFGLLQTVSYARDPYALYAKLSKRYGDPFCVQTIAGPLVVSGHPEGARQIFSAEPDLFQPWATYLFRPLLGEFSLLLVHGARHRRDRKLLTPPFHGARMRAYGEIMQRAALREASRWRQGYQFSMQDSTQAISLDVILRTVFGVVEPARVAEFSAAILAVLGGAESIALFVPALRLELGGHAPWGRFMRAREALDKLLYREIAARRQSGARGEDILSLILDARYEDGAAMSDGEVRDELLTLLLAGHETTAIALAWSFYWLSREHDARAKLLAELDALGPSPTPEALAAAPYLDAVCSETLRLHPIVPDVVRQLRGPFEFRGYGLSAGQAVGVAITLIHQREDLYPEPTRFRPERFLERKFSPFEFLPFGGGARRCLGAAFAQYEMKIVLGTIAREYNLRCVGTGEVRPVRRTLTLGPEHGVRMTLAGRRLPRGSGTVRAVADHTTAG